MDRLTIKCASCEQVWQSPVSFSVYQQQAIEACPCPHCGANTLACQEPAKVKSRSSQRSARTAVALSA